MCLKVHQLPQPALVCHDAAAFGVNQFINQRGMPHRVVRWVLLYAAQYGVVLIKSLLHGRGNRGGQQFCGGYIINILQRVSTLTRRMSILSASRRMLQYITVRSSRPSGRR